MGWVKGTPEDDFHDLVPGRWRWILPIGRTNGLMNWFSDAVGSAVPDALRLFCMAVNCLAEPTQFPCRRAPRLPEWCGLVDSHKVVLEAASCDRIQDKRLPGF